MSGCDRGTKRRYRGYHQQPDDHLGRRAPGLLRERSVCHQPERESDVGGTDYRSDSSESVEFHRLPDDRRYGAARWTSDIAAHLRRSGFYSHDWAVRADVLFRGSFGQLWVLVRGYL